MELYLRSPYFFMAWCFIKYKNNATVYNLLYPQCEDTPCHNDKYRPTHRGITPEVYSACYPLLPPVLSPPPLERIRDHDLALRRGRDWIGVDPTSKQASSKTKASLNAQLKYVPGNHHKFHTAH
jgi:hypothetical protein